MRATLAADQAPLTTVEYYSALSLDNVLASAI